MFNMYIRISRGDRRLEQIIQKNLVVLVIARKVGNTDTILIVLISEPIVFHANRSYPWAPG